MDDRTSPALRTGAPIAPPTFLEVKRAHAEQAASEILSSLGTHAPHDQIVAAAKVVGMQRGLSSVDIVAAAERLQRQSDIARRDRHTVRRKVDDWGRATLQSDSDRDHRAPRLNRHAQCHHEAAHISLAAMKGGIQAFGTQSGIIFQKGISPLFPIACRTFRTTTAEAESVVLAGGCAGALWAGASAAAAHRSAHLHSEAATSDFTVWMGMRGRHPHDPSVEDTKDWADAVHRAGLLLKLIRPEFEAIAAALVAATPKDLTPDSSGDLLMPWTHSALKPHLIAIAERRTS